MSNILAHNFSRDDSSGALLNTDVRSLNSYKHLRDNKIATKNRFADIEKNLKQVKDDINSIKDIVNQLCSLRN